MSERAVIVQNALVGMRLRDRIAIRCSGKIAVGNDIIRREALGADFCSVARPMMMVTAASKQSTATPTRVPAASPRRTPHQRRRRGGQGAARAMLSAVLMLVAWGWHRSTTRIPSYAAAHPPRP
ncbi:hypothetical protein DEO23_15825 [Brachybacterium endophyticum]|uniref:Glutamate synthase domain-containing protein n=1 Tax=Brachybacterium endophyticum TaxID=2182385 RepID=A0A2U2RGE2_9MICO|nr:hypothetical protein DEO23_15825 [Brachybacterium endophyticum]